MGIETNMKQYGLSEAIQKAADHFSDLTVSRVILQEKGIYRLISSEGEKWGEISGRFHYDVQEKSEYPAVGDFVMADWNKSGGHAVIHRVLPRKSSFIRKAAGEKKEEQIVAANIDTIFLCMSMNNDYNLRRLERYLSIAWNSGAVPVVILTKADLCEDPESRLMEISSIAAGVDVLITNAVEKAIENYKPTLEEKIGTHDLILVSSLTSTVVDLTLINTQTALSDYITALQTKLDTITATFTADQKQIFEGDFFLKGRISIYVYVWTVYLVLFDKNIKQVRKCFKREEMK